MFNINIPSAETYKISTRPAVFKSLAQLLEYLSLHQNHRIFFNGEAEVSKLLGGLYNDKRGSDIKTDLGYDDKIFVELESDLSDFNSGLDSENKDGQTVPLMWQDPITRSSIRPVFTGRKYTVTLNKYFKDRVTAQTFQRRIRSMVLGSQINTLFDVDTHYPISEQILTCFHSIYKKLVKGGAIVEKPNETFITWFRKQSLCPTEIISNLIGNNDCLVFKQQCADNGLMYSDVNMAKVTKGQYVGHYIVDWNYSFYWNEHVSFELRYPIQIYQQQIEDKWIPEVFEINQLDKPSSVFLESALSRQVFSRADSPSPYYHVLPREDNWRAAPLNWISNQLQILVNMEDVQEQVVLNIKDIHGFKWNERFLHYVMKYRTKVTRRHHSPFNFKLYSDNIEVVETQIELRENGDLVFTRPPTMKNIYRLVFSMDYALRLYTDDCIKDLLDDPEYAWWILPILFPSVEIPPNFGGDGTDDWWDIHNQIDVGDGEQVDVFPRGMMGLLLIAHNQNDPQYQKRF